MGIPIDDVDAVAAAACLSDEATGDVVRHIDAVAIDSRDRTRSNGYVEPGGNRHNVNKTDLEYECAKSVQVVQGATTKEKEGNTYKRM